VRALASSVGSGHEILENCVNALLVHTVKPRFLFECRAMYKPCAKFKTSCRNIFVYKLRSWERCACTLFRTPKWQPHVLNICVECSMSWNYTLLSSAVRLFAPFGTSVSQQHKVQADSCTGRSHFSKFCHNQRSSRDPTLVSIVR